ncbi:unnamed protein product [Prunus armeniaca]
MDDNDLGDIRSHPYEFVNVIGDRDQPLYPGCRNTLPSSMYKAKKTLSALGMSYEKIHACPNDYILYRKDYEDSTNCHTCGISRWKEGKDSILKEAKSLTWHADRKSVDGHISHPANLSRAEKRMVCNSFYGMKVPEGYSSNIKNLVSLKDSRLLGLKSHDATIAPYGNSFCFGEACKVCNNSIVLLHQCYMCEDGRCFQAR